MGFVSKVYGLAVHKSRLKTSKRKKRKGKKPKKSITPIYIGRFKS
jgi:hypothetical protein